MPPRYSAFGTALNPRRSGRRAFVKGAALVDSGNGYLTGSVQRRHDGTVVVRLGGELDFDSLDLARRVLAEAERVADDAQMVLDVSGLDFIGASGLGLLSAAGAEHRRRKGLPLRVVGARPLLRRLVALDHVDPGLQLDPPG